MLVLDDIKEPLRQRMHWKMRDGDGRTEMGTPWGRCKDVGGPR